MDHSQAAFKKYRRQFPSDEFLHKYFGADVESAPPGMPLFGVSMYADVRRRFDFVMRCTPMRLMRWADRYQTGLERTYVFINGQFSDWALHAFEINGLPPVAMQAVAKEVFTEFVSHVETRVFHEEDWWQWFVEDTSVGIEPTPTANLTGGNRPRQSLDDMFARSSS